MKVITHIIIIFSLATLFSVGIWIYDGTWRDDALIPLIGAIALSVIIYIGDWLDRRKHGR